MFTFIFLGFTYGFASVDVEETILLSNASRIKWFIKEQIYDHRLTPADVRDISTITQEQRYDCRPVVAEIVRNEDKASINVYWVNLSGELYNYFSSKPAQNPSFLEEHSLKSVMVKNYVLEKKDEKWANACRDFDKMFGRMAFMPSFEVLNKENQNMIISYFQSTGNIDDSTALLRDLFKMEDAMIAEAEAQSALNIIT